MFHSRHESRTRSAMYFLFTSLLFSMGISGFGAGPASLSPSAAIEFQPGKIYEVSGLWIKPGAQQTLSEYFGKAMPVAMKYGAKPLMQFQPTRAAFGDFMPSVVGLAEWPSSSAFRQFMRDPEYLKLAPVRDSALTKMVVIHNVVSGPVSIQFDPNKVYEFAALWMKPEKAEQLSQYFKSAMPVAMKYGAKPLAQFTPVSVPFGDMKPTSIGLSEWPSAEAFDGFLQDSQYKALAPSRDAALTKMTVTHTRAAVQ